MRSSSRRPQDKSEYAVALDDVSIVRTDADNSTKALHDLSLGIRRGRFCAIMGPAGSGKTTLLQCMAGLAEPSAGAVRWGHAEREAISALWSNCKPSGSDGTVRDLVYRSASAMSRRQAWLIRRVTGLWLWTRPLRTLRPAQLQQAVMAGCLARSPRLLLIDAESLAHPRQLSPLLGKSVRRAVKLLGLTAVLVTHDPVTASYADSVVFLHNGRLVDAVGRSSSKEIAECLHHVESRPS